jgi:hypothetical protein
MRRVKLFFAGTSFLAVSEPHPFVDDVLIYRRLNEMRTCFGAAIVRDEHVDDWGRWGKFTP